MNKQYLSEMGRIIKFSELDNDIQKAFFATEEMLKEKGFLFYPNPLSKKGILWLCFLIVIGSTFFLFLGGILSNKVAFVEILKWIGVWFGFISVVSFLWGFSQYKNTAIGSGYLLTDSSLIFFINKELVKLLPLKTLNVSEGKEGFVFDSGEVSFEVRYDYACDKKFSEFFAEIVLKLPQLKNILKNMEQKARE